MLGDLPLDELRELEDRPEERLEEDERDLHPEETVPLGRLALEAKQSVCRHQICGIDLGPPGRASEKTNSSAICGSTCECVRGIRCAVCPSAADSEPLHQTSAYLWRWRRRLSYCCGGALLLYRSGSGRGSKPRPIDPRIALASTGDAMPCSTNARVLKLSGHLGPGHHNVFYTEQHCSNFQTHKA